MLKIYTYKKLKLKRHEDIRIETSGVVSDAIVTAAAAIAGLGFLSVVEAWLKVRVAESLGTLEELTVGLEQVVVVV